MPATAPWGEGWEELIGVVLGAWREESKPSGPSAELVASMAEKPQRLRQPLLALLRDRLSRYPFGRVHPTWLIAGLPEDPLLRQWALGSLSKEVQRALLPHLARLPAVPGVRVDPFGPPSWFPTWWSRRLESISPYPHPRPHSITHDQPITWLWCLDSGGLELVLTTRGLRVLAGILRGLGRTEVVDLVYQFESPHKERLVELVRREAGPDPATWRPFFDEHRPELRGAALAFRLGLEELGAGARAHGKERPALRVAYRLPMDQGRLLVEAVRNDSARAPDSEWEAGFAEDVELLLEAGHLARPEIEEEVL